MIVNLRVGQIITPARAINPIMIGSWRYAAECTRLGGTLLPGAELQVVEVSTVPGRMWVKAAILSQSPPGVWKIAGEEYAQNFRSMP